MAEHESRIEAALRAGPPDEDGYSPPPWDRQRAVATPVRHGLVGTALERAPRLRRGWASAGVGAVLAASLVILVGALLLGRPAPDRVAGEGPSDATILRDIREFSLVDDPRILGRATANGHTVVFFEGRRESDPPGRDIFGSVLWRGSEKAVAGLSDGLAPAVDVSILGAGSTGIFPAGSGGSAAGTTTVDPGFVAGWVRDGDVGEIEIRDDRGNVLRAPVSSPVFLVALDGRFDPEREKTWRLRAPDGAPRYHGGTGTRTTPVSEFASPSPTPPPPVAEMLPSTRGGEEMDLTRVDLSGGVLRDVVLRLGRTSADVEAAGRSPSGAADGSITGLRIAYVEGDRLMDAYVEAVRDLVEGDGSSIDVEPVSLGGRPVTRLDVPGAPEPTYLFVTGDTLFVLEETDEATAADWVGQIP